MSRTRRKRHIGRGAPDIALWCGVPAQTANFGVDVDEFPAQVLKITELSDLALGFAFGGHGSKAFGVSLTVDLICQPEVRTMTGIAGLRATATGLAAPPHDGANRSRSEISQPANLVAQSGAAQFKLTQRLSHPDVSVPATFRLTT
jgi:hypothetical protein